jgi:hypothetical protein
MDTTGVNHIHVQLIHVLQLNHGTALQKQIVKTQERTGVPIVTVYQLHTRAGVNHIHVQHIHVHQVNHGTVTQKIHVKVPVQAGVQILGGDGAKQVLVQDVNLHKHGTVTQKVNAKVLVLNGVLIIMGLDGVRNQV